MSHSQPAGNDPNSELAGIVYQTLFTPIESSRHEVVCVSLLLAAHLSELITQHAGEATRHDFQPSIQGVEAAAELVNKLVLIAYRTYRFDFDQLMTQLA